MKTPRVLIRVVGALLGLIGILGCSRPAYDFVNLSLSKANPAQALGPCDPGHVSSSPYADGTGDLATPYLICTAAQLNAIGLTSTDWSKSFKLAADIDLSAYTGTQFNMIGTSVTKFTGVFDGNGHTISNLTIAINTATYVGLFGYVYTGADIKNFNLSNVSITAQKTNVIMGAVIGNMEGGTLSNVKVLSGAVNPTFTQVSQMVGGAVGALTDATLTNVISNVTFSVSSRALYLGGVVGLANQSTLTSVGFTGLIPTGTVVSYAGGIAGALDNTVVDSSFSTGNVNNASAQAAGGAVGAMWDNSSLSKTFASGNVVGYSFGTGGLVGQLSSAVGYGLFNSYATGSVTGTFTLPRGALVGKVGGGAPTITNCYATGAVDASGSSNGGFIGTDDAGGGLQFATYTGNYWNTQTNSTLSGFGLGTNASGVSGASTSVLQLPATFIATPWSGAIWNLTTPGQYPKFAWQP